MPPTHDLDRAAIGPRRKLGVCQAASGGAGRGETVGPAITRSLTTLRLSAAAAAFAAGAVVLPAASLADEGGTSFWVPGTFGSFAAVPETPGWSLTMTNYFTSTNAGDDVATARAITTGRIKPTVRLDETSSYTSRYDTVSFNPSYAFATSVLGGQFSLGVTVPIGSQTVGLDRVLTSVAGTSAATRRNDESDTTTGFGDVAPMAQLHWSSGVNNWMTYATANLPVGTYNTRNLANIGIGHGAIDGGGGYTYYDAKKGSEFSVVTGSTYNFIDQSTSYQNGVDWHVDWALSQSVSKEIYVGAVGYIYDQISADSGAGDHVGAFESRVMGIGPQVSFTLPAGPLQAALNLKAYWEFDAGHRPSGWNAWATLSLSPNEPAADKPKPVVTK
jgi:hypothetical protein